MNKEEIFPFISPYNVTIVKQGIYKKDKAKFYGPSMIKDRDTNGLKAVRLGYIEVKTDSIVIPKMKNNLTLKNKMKMMVYSLLNYQVVNKLETNLVSITPNTKEFEEARVNYDKYSKRYDKINNRKD